MKRGDAILVFMLLVLPCVLLAQAPKPSLLEQGLHDDIHSVDFRNFDYPSDCWAQMNDRFDKKVSVSNGTWQDLDRVFHVDQILYGDLKGDGRPEAVVVASCSYTGLNSESTVTYVFEMSSAGLKRLAALYSHDPNLGVRVSGTQLLLSYSEGGLSARPEWIVTAKFQWSGTALVRVGEDRKRFTNWLNR